MRIRHREVFCDNESLLVRGGDRAQRVALCGVKFVGPVTVRGCVGPRDAGHARLWTDSSRCESKERKVNRADRRCVDSVGKYLDGVERWRVVPRSSDVEEA